jgi:hypothetical protein
MESVGLFEIVAQWTAALIPVLASYAGARKNKNQGRRLSRSKYLKLLLVLGLCNLLAIAIMQLTIPLEVHAAIIGLFSIPLSAFFNAYWAVDRIRDTGSQRKALAYFVGFLPTMPFINLYLLIKPGAPRRE